MERIGVDGCALRDVGADNALHFVPLESVQDMELHAAGSLIVPLQQHSDRNLARDAESAFHHHAAFLRQGMLRAFPPM